MEEELEEFTSEVDYSTVLDNFNGPLDLLLHLVQEAKIEIRDIFVSQVTDQFLQYMNGLDKIDVGKASEYLDMAARLVEIKSRALLPAPDDDIDDFTDDDPEEVLIRQLEEYKLFKEKAEELKEKEDVNRFYKPPEESAGEVRLVYKDFNLDGLIDAFTHLMMRADLRAKKKAKEIRKDAYTVADRIGFIRDALKLKEKCSFFELFGKDPDRAEIITTFQALLELLKLQYLSVSQKGTYEDIVITLREDRSEDLGDLSKELAEYN